MIRPDITAEASATEPASAVTPARRPGRPRRPVRLSSPAVRPLLGAEHQDALTALSALLGDLGEAAATGPVPDDVSTTPQPADATRRILAQLSSPAATIDPSTPRRRVA